jgi:nudix-type nucleoside diphosphatase (YffH/AdpP family)
MTTLFLAAPLSDPVLRATLRLSGPATGAAMPGSQLVDGGPGGLPCRRIDAAGRVDGAIVACLPEAVDLVRFVAGGIGWRVVDGPPDCIDGQNVDLALLPAETGEGAAWAAEPFAARWLPVWREALPEIVDHRGRFDPVDLAERLPYILSRAHAVASGRRTARPYRGRFSADDVTLLDRRRPYSGFFAVDELILTHKRHDGGQSAPLERAVFLSADAVTVLPYDPVRDRVLLVEQFRAAPFARGDRSPWILEPVAGRIEPGHSPQDTARKEALEEAGLTLGALHPVAEYYPSTGCFSEYVHSFVGIADLPDREAGLHGVADEDEDIRAIVIPRVEFLERMLAGEMPDAPLILTAYWLMANLERLRGVG